MTRFAIVTDNKHVDGLIYILTDDDERVLLDGIGSCNIQLAPTAVPTCQLTLLAQHLNLTNVEGVMHTLLGGKQFRLVDENEFDVIAKDGTHDHAFQDIEVENSAESIISTSSAEVLREDVVGSKCSTCGSDIGRGDRFRMWYIGPSEQGSHEIFCAACAEDATNRGPYGRAMKLCSANGNTCMFYAGHHGPHTDASDK